MLPWDLYLFLTVWTFLCASAQLSLANQILLASSPSPSPPPSSSSSSNSFFTKQPFVQSFQDCLFLSLKIWVCTEPPGICSFFDSFVAVVAWFGSLLCLWVPEGDLFSYLSPCRRSLPSTDSRPFSLSSKPTTEQFSPPMSASLSLHLWFQASCLPHIKGDLWLYGALGYPKIS